jgi:alpha-tubulin suppressor-like RCC1 family protein
MLYTTIDRNKTLVYSWGANNWGSLGIGSDEKEKISPTLIETILENNFKKVACGSYHTILQEVGGSLFTFGCNIYLQLGLSGGYTSPIYLSTPAQLELLNNQKSRKIFCWNCTSGCITEDNEAFIWGSIGEDCNELENMSQTEKKRDVINENEVVAEPIQLPKQRSMKKQKLTNLILTTNQTFMIARKGNLIH